VGYVVGTSSGAAVDWQRWLTTVCGVFVLAAGASALNQVQERRIDAEMTRTARRPLPSARVSIAAGSFFVLSGLSFGLALLSLLGGHALVLGVASVVLYNGFYTMWWKRSYRYATILGAIPGALPILIGHAVAAGEVLTKGGVYLFLLLFTWQMPHFWALALRYKDDYAGAGLPMLPVVIGIRGTLNHIRIWSSVLVVIVLLGPFVIELGRPYLVLSFVSMSRLVLGLFHFSRGPEERAGTYFHRINEALILVFAALVLDRLMT